MTTYDNRDYESVLKVARVLCIAFLVYAHIGIPTPASGEGMVTGMLNQAILSLHYGLSRVSVPLLGMISGLLAYSSIRKTTHWGLVKRKFVNLYIPMVIWSGVMIVIYLAYGLITKDFVFLAKHLPSDLQGWINALFSISEWPANTPLYFLRDIFICYIFLPVFMLVLDVSTVLCVAIALATFLSNGTFWIGGENWLSPYLRPSTTAFFLLGLSIAKFRQEKSIRFGEACSTLRHLVIPLGVALLAGIYIKITNLNAATTSFSRTSEFLVRIAGALFFWSLALNLAQRTLGMQLGKLEKYAYLVFCMHYPLTYVLAQIVGIALHWQEPWVVKAIMFLTAPAVCFYAASLIHARIRYSRHGAILIGLPRSIDSRQSQPSLLR